MENFEIVDFRFASSNDAHDNKYELPHMWSRPYEYKYVTDFIKGAKLEAPKIHNSSWGFEGVHVIFRDELDEIGDCVHSDIVSSQFRDTYYYDITEENSEFENKFDFVLNVSVIEHLPTPNDRINAFENLYKQVKLGGYMILTFDYPTVNLNEFETLVGGKCVVGENVLNGSNSVIKNETYKGLNVVYLILRKNE